MNPLDIQDIITNAFAEDLGDGDHTTLSTVPENAKGKARLLVKDNGIIAGLELAEQIFHHLDPELKLEFFNKDGDEVMVGDVAFTVEGSSRSILMTERLVLNFMQRMSGIATQTKSIVSKIDGLSTKVLDTRKTTPGLRVIEKWAVTIGGGNNHRFGLYDMVMIKDNHVDYAGGITNAVTGTKEYLKKHNKDIKIEVEVRNFDELNEALAAGGVDRIMLDNFTPADVVKGIEIINGQCETEASGGITMDTIRSYAETGVDYISVGALTHSFKSLDLSLKASYDFVQDKQMDLNQFDKLNKEK
jgi:nicotinate-nucleotide pyrophosphorylase (carboxylating)